MSDPEVVHSSVELSGHLDRRRRAGARIGLVPTMGALHEGHTSLIRRAALDNDYTVLTIFVNPAQFGPGEDLDQYPRTAGRDRQLAGEAGADIIFHPEVGEIYPEGYRTYIDVEGLSDKLCGAFRPGHFRGVATVVWKLLQIVDPTVAYFGAKDAQQLIIIRRMVRDLGGRWRIAALPTRREKDGLALSSRNNYLGKEERIRSTVLYRALGAARRAVESGERRRLAVIDAMRRVLDKTEGMVVEYVECASLSGLERIELLSGELIVALAVKFGSTRLIDNICLRVNDSIEEILP